MICTINGFDVLNVTGVESMATSLTPITRAHGSVLERHRRFHDEAKNSTPYSMKERFLDEREVQATK